MEDAQEPDVTGSACSPSISQANMKCENITDLEKSKYTSTTSLGCREFCRICRETGKDELYSHCKCKGSIGLAHTPCLLFWIKKSGLIKCELCHERYSTISRINWKFWQWKLPRVGTKGWFKFVFFIGFLSMLITFTTWIIWSRMSSSTSAMKERNKRQVEYTYLVYGVLVLIAIVAMYMLNFRPCIRYFSRCLVVNQNTTIIPRGELCAEQPANTAIAAANQHCKHSVNSKDLQSCNKDDNVKYSSWKRYEKLQGEYGDIAWV